MNDLNNKKECRNSVDGYGMISKVVHHMKGTGEEWDAHDTMTEQRSREGHTHTHTFACTHLACPWESASKE